MKTYLICPDFEQVVSGGSWYNKKLIEASSGGITPIFYRDDKIEQIIHDIPPDGIILIDSLILKNVGFLISKSFYILCHLPGFLNPHSEKGDHEREIKLYKNHPIIVTGQRMKDKLIKDLNIFHRNIYTIPPGLDFNERKQKYSNVLQQLVWVGNLSPIKGFAEMLDELKDLQQYNWHLDVFGSTDFDKEYTLKVNKKMIEYQLDKCISFKESIPHNELMRQLIEYDLMIQFSQFESFGMAVYEALSMGLPVLGLNLDIEPYFRNYTHCFSAKNEIEWRKKLLFLFQNPKGLKKINPLEIRTWKEVYNEYKTTIKV